MTQTPLLGVSGLSSPRTLLIKVLFGLLRSGRAKRVTRRHLRCHRPSLVNLFLRFWSLDTSESQGPGWSRNTAICGTANVDDWSR
jgi:hypothetical protein